jgi:hypothetical protein
MFSPDMTPQTIIDSMQSAGHFFALCLRQATGQRSRLFVCLLAACGAMSCGRHLNRLTPHDYARIRNQAEILSYHASLPQIEIRTFADIEDAAGSSGSEGGSWLEELVGDLLEEIFFSYDPEKAEKELRYADELLTLPLTDPVQQVEDGFLGGLEESLGSRNQWVAEESLLWDQIDFEELQAQVPGAIVFHFETTRWQLVPARDKKYRLRYSVQVRAMRVEDLDTIWEETCEYNRRFRRGAPYKILRRLARDDGARLKSALLEATEQCVETLVSEFTERAATQR